MILHRAEPTITAMFGGMGDAAGVRVSATPVDGEDATSKLSYQWSFGPEREFGYDTTGTATQTGDEWRISWSPSLLHRDLRSGLRFQFSEDSDLQTPLLDRAGQSLLSWQTVGVVTLDRAHAASAADLASVPSQFDGSTTSES